MEERKKIITVVGSAEPCEENYLLAMELGMKLVDNGYRVATGGLGGIMKAVLEGARQSANYQNGDTLGIIPGDDRKTANKFADIVIPTGMGYARNCRATGLDGGLAL